MAKQMVWVLHVVDEGDWIELSAHSTREKGRRYLANLVREWWSEQHGPSGRLLPADDEGAILYYFDHWEKQQEFHLIPLRIDPGDDEEATSVST